MTFQQVQKYENGANRIGASRLQQIAIALNAPLGSFFDGTVNARSPSVKSEADELEAFAAEFLATADGIRFFRAFRQVRDLPARTTIINLVVMLAASSDEKSIVKNAKNVGAAA